tara:strand:+ start:518 stop:826 length:309 start_codon:yes stop_codon:yes gene_type:complete
MINISKQRDINSNFKNIFKNMIFKFKLDTMILIDNFNEFEKNDIQDKETKKIIKSMLDIPYYENLEEINILRKFKLLKELLLVIHNELIVENLNKRLQKLRN